MASPKIEKLALSARSPPPVPPQSCLVIARSNPRADIAKMASYLRSKGPRQIEKLRRNGGHLVEDFFDASDRKELGDDFLAAALDQVAEANEELHVLDFAANWSIHEVNGKFPNVMGITGIHTAFGDENVKKFGSTFLELALKFIKGAFKQTVDDYNARKGLQAEQQGTSSGSVTKSPEDQHRAPPDTIESPRAGLSASQHEITASTPVRSATSATEGDRAAHLSKADQAQHLETLNTQGSTIQDLPSVRYRSVRINQRSELKPYAPPSVQQRLLHRDASSPRMTRMNEPAYAVTAAPPTAPGQGNRALHAVQPLHILKDPVITVPAAAQAPNLTLVTAGMPMRMAPMADQIVAAGVYHEYGHAYQHMFVSPALHPGSPMLGPQLQHPYFGNESAFRNRVYEEPSSIETPSHRDSFSTAQSQRRQSFSSQTGLHSAARYRGSGTSYPSRTRRNAEESYLDQALDGQTARQPRPSFSSDRARPPVDRHVVHQLAEAFAEHFHPDDICDEHHIGRNRTEVTELYVKGFPSNASQAQISRAIAEQIRVPVKEVHFSTAKNSTARVAFAHFNSIADTRTALGVGRIMLEDRPIQLTVPRVYHGPRRDYPTSLHEPRSHVTPRGPAAYGELWQRTQPGHDFGSPYTARRFSEPARHGPVYVSQSTREHYAKDGRVSMQEEVIVEEEDAPGTYSSQDARSDIHRSPQKSRMTSRGSSFGEGPRSPQKRRTGSSSQGFASRRASSVQDPDVSRNQKMPKQQDRHKRSGPVSISPAKEPSDTQTPKPDRPGSGSDEHKDQSHAKRLGSLGEGTSVSSHITRKPIDAKRPDSPSSNLGVDAKNGEKILRQRSGQEQQLSVPRGLTEKSANSQSAHSDPFSGQDDRVKVAVSADDLATSTPAPRSTLPQVQLFENNPLRGSAGASGLTSAYSAETTLADAVGRAKDLLAYTRSDDTEAQNVAAGIGSELQLGSESDNRDSLPVLHVEAGSPSKLKKARESGKTESLVPQGMLSKKPQMKRHAKAKAKLEQQHSNTPSAGRQSGQRKETQLPVITSKQSAPDENLSEQSKQTSGREGSTSPSTEQPAIAAKPNSDVAARPSETEQVQHMLTSEALEESTIEEPKKVSAIDVQRTDEQSGFTVAAESRDFLKPESKRPSTPGIIEEAAASTKVDDAQTGRTDEVAKTKRKKKPKKKSKTVQNLSPLPSTEVETVPFRGPDIIACVPTHEDLAQAGESMEQNEPSGDNRKTFSQERPPLRTPIISLDTYFKARNMLDNAIQDQHRPQQGDGDSRRRNLPQAVAMCGGSVSPSQGHATMETSSGSDCEAGSQKCEAHSVGHKAGPEVAVALHQATSGVELSPRSVCHDGDDVDRAHRRDSAAKIVDAAPGSVVEGQEVTTRGTSEGQASALKSQSKGQSSDIEVSPRVIVTTGHDSAEALEIQQVDDRSERGEDDIAGSTSVTKPNAGEQFPGETARSQLENSVAKAVPLPKRSWATVASAGSILNTQSSSKAAPSQGKAAAAHGSTTFNRDKDESRKSLVIAQEDPWLATEAPWTERAKNAVLLDRVKTDTRVAVPRISFPKKEGKPAGAGKDEDGPAELVKSQQPMAQGKENLSVREETQKKDDASMYQRRKDGTFTKGG